MPDPTGTKVDGGVVFGSQEVTITAVVYIAENIQVDADSKEIDRNDEYGVPNGQVLVRTKRKGSMTLQLAASTTIIPALFAEVSITPTGAGATALVFLIKKVGQAYSHEGETKVNVDLVEKLGA